MTVKIRVRPITLADFENGTLREGMEVYWYHPHAGEVTWDPAEIIRFDKPEITTQEPGEFAWAPRREPTGDGRWYKVRGYIKIRSRYGLETIHATDLELTEVMLFHPEGEHQIVVTPEYGSLVTVYVTVPDAEPEVAEKLVLDRLSQGPGYVANVSAKPLADRWVNIYEYDQGNKGTLIRANILEGERYAYNGLGMVVAEEISSGLHEQSTNNLLAMRRRIDAVIARRNGEEC